MSGDVTKLPKWAQDEIRRLRTSVEYWEAQVTQGPEDANTFLSIRGDKLRPLGRNESVVFDFEGGFEVRARLIKQPGRPEYLDITSVDSGLSVQPQSSNVIKVAPERAW